MTPRLDHGLYPPYPCPRLCFYYAFGTSYPYLWIGLCVVRVVCRRQRVIVSCLDPSMTELELEV